MPYFQDFNVLRYDFTTPSDPAPIVESIVDLTQRVRLKISDADLDILCVPYVIQEGETPEKISYKLYNSPEFHWVILYINKITSYYNSWPMTEAALGDFCVKKYGSTNVNNVHHYFCLPYYIQMDAQFIIDNYGASSVLEVTNYDYETRLNELKRFIKVIDPKRLTAFVDMYRQNMLLTSANG